MSVAAVLAAVETKCQGITGVTLSTSQGWPEPLAVLRAPTCVVEVQTPNYTLLTGGSAGAVETQYTVAITLVLGGVDMQPKRALALAAPFVERFRAAFWADPTLGGVCWRSELTSGVTNLRSYRKNKTTPKITWRLTVRELGAVDGGSPPQLVLGPGAYCGIGAAGAETNISRWLTAVGMAEGSSEFDATPYGAAAAVSVPGLSRGYVQLFGKFDASLNTLLANMRRVAGKSLVIGPGGNVAGLAKLSVTGWLRDYDVDVDSRGGPVSWRAFFRASGAFVHGTF